MADAVSNLRRQVTRLLSAARRLFSLRYGPVIASVLMVVAGALAGVLTARALDFGRLGREAATLGRYRPSEVITVYADDDKTEIGRFVPLRHKPLKFEQITPLMRNAILAVEDPRLYDGPGLDPARLVRAAARGLASGGAEDGTTLTRQLARKLSSPHGIKGRIQTWLTAFQLERFYTKDQLVEAYANHVWLGGNLYGFQAGAEAFFNKPIGGLTAEEAALLAGVPRSPEQYSPVLNVEGARGRRDRVLDLMVLYGFLSAREASDAKAVPVQTAPASADSPRDWQFDYPLEEIKRYLGDRYGSAGGLRVYTTINVAAQTTAVEELRAALRDYDRKQNVWRSRYANIGTSPGTPTQQQLDTYQHPHWYREDFQRGSYVVGLVTRVDRDRNEATVRFGSYTAVVRAQNMGWSGRQPRDEFRAGDLAEFEVRKKIPQTSQLEVELSQVPEVKGALVTLNAKNGEVVATVGGYDFNADTLNHATAAHETGSAFKPFIYAAAVEWGFGPDSNVSGAPVRRGNWQPRNYDGSLGHQEVQMKAALVRNYNLAPVHLLDMVGIQAGAEIVRRFGITTPMSPYLPSALGETEAPLSEMVSAYSVLANRGVRVAPHLIRRVTDREGRTLEEGGQTSFKAVSDYVALTVSEMLRGVVEEGPAKGVSKELGRPVAGMVGVTADGADRWFVGYTPTYVTGVWVDAPARGSQPALSLFVSFMKYFLNDKPAEDFEKPPPVPEDIKKLYEQRMREMAEERQLLRGAGGGDAGGLPAQSLETITLPPAPAADASDSPPAARPREVEPRKKRGKKGEDDNEP